MMPPRAHRPPQSPIAVIAASPSSKRREDALRRPTATSGPEANTGWQLSGSPPPGPARSPPRPATPGRGAAPRPGGERRALAAAGAGRVEDRVNPRRAARGPPFEDRDLVGA